MALLYGTRAILRQKTLLRSFKRHGYIVLVPEIGEDLPDKNPLMQNDGLPEFSNITIENCMAAIGKQTTNFEGAVKNIENSIEKQQVSDVFKDIIEPLEEKCAPLEMTWGLSKTLYLGNSILMPTKSYLSIHERAKRARSSKFNSIPIYETIKKELGENLNISDEQKRVLNKFLLEGKLNGLELTESKREHLQSNLKKIAEEKDKFKQKVEKATNQFYHNINDPIAVREFHVDLLKKMAPDPNTPLTGPWKVTLQPNIYIPILEHCPYRDVRWNIWQALVSRCSGYSNRELRSSLHLEEIRYLRRDLAKLLGYDTFAEMSMQTKMAGSIENVMNMLHALLEYAKPAQESELQSLYEFAKERNFEGTAIELWDVPYWRRKQLKSVYGYQEDDFKEYFPLNKVIEGLFSLCEKLFSLVIKQRSGVSTWHKDVRFYDIYEAHTSAPVAGFYLDPYARSDDKQVPQNGWIVGIQNHSRITDNKPLAALVFNFQRPTAEKPSYLTFKEVQALFSRFGHALQHLLTRTTYAEVSGLSNIEWDAVEVCGNVLSHWLLNKTTIDSISSHCDSEDKLPANMFNSLMNAHKHMAGLDLCRELYLSALDLELHSSRDFWLDVVKDLWPQYRSFPLDKLDSHPCSFTQIFYEEWAAAYYSRLWSRVIAADVYSAFHEVQEDEQQVLDVGKRFRDTFLALGGSCHSSQVFRKFRGRDLSPKAILKSLGLKKKKIDKK